MIHLQGHTALITGSSQGIGLAVAKAMAVAGADVILHGRDDSDRPLDALNEIRALGRQASYLPADLVGPSQAIAKQLFAAAIEIHHEIDILVSNAGGYFDTPFLDMDFESFDRTMKLNVYAGFFLVQEFARHWIKEKIQGRVLLTGSINGRLAEEDHVAYDTSKGAVEMMVKSLCVALAPHNIRVNGMAPGLVRTPLTSILEKDAKFDDWMCQHTPNGTVPEADVCGGAAVFLCSDMAQHIHGQMLLVDGGMSVWQQPVPPHLRNAK